MKKLWFAVALSFLTGSVWAASVNHLDARQTQLNQTLLISPWEFELGARLWFSSGNIGAPQPLLNYTLGPRVLASRLIYQDLSAYTGETFLRLNHQSGWFMKAFLGAGSITSGTLNDEDFPAGPVYSNTMSTGVGSLAYANIDLGHHLFKNTDASFGSFLGYNYYSQQFNASGCSQLASSTVCTFGAIPTNYPGIVEADRFNSLRLGFNNQFRLSDRIKIMGDVAYLPIVAFNGRDDHNARMLPLLESATIGDGMMLEAIFSYNITDHWDLGLGGRYWAWNMRNGFVTFEFPEGPSIIEPARFNSERFGVFIQSNYHWDDRPHQNLSSEEPMNWRGLSLAAALGGGWGNEQWSDPFPSSYGPYGYINVAGFGDSIHSIGPLGAGQVDYRWQGGSWVTGLEVDASLSDLRGENTCFSGLGGINCQSIVRSMATTSIEVGRAWDRSLLYLKGGAAWTHTTYNLNGNTNDLMLGTGSDTLWSRGWTAGIGIEHAFTDHWVTLIEYDYLATPATRVSFPSVALVDAQTITVRQSLNLFKLGLKYKFDF